MAITRSQMYRQLYQIGGLSSLYNNSGGQKPIYPRISDIESSLSNAEQKIGDPSLGSFGGTSDGEFSSPMGGVYSQSTGGELPPIQQAMAQGPLQIPSTLINPVRDGVDTSQLGSPRTGGMGSYIDVGQLSSLFGGVGDPRLGAPDVPNSLQQVMRGARADGGMMGRQMYGLGSLVKKAVKGVKSFVKSDLGKAAILGIGAFGLPGGALGMKGFMPQNLRSLSGIGSAIFGGGALPPSQGLGQSKGLFGMAKNFLKTPGGAYAGITAASALAAAGLDPENPNEMPRNTEALKSYLRQGYLTLNPQAQPDEVEEFVEANTVEYRANGGRIGFAEGMLSFEEAKAMNPGMFSAEVETDVVSPNTELLNYIKRIRDAVKKGIIPMDFAMDLIKQKTMEQGVDLQDLRDDIMETQRVEQAYGGRLGFAFGNKPEQNAIQAAGIMNLPLHQNPAGVTELDLRETGGFIPPVGVKEKADDIPAMLSNNEFVFTAKSVKEMGDGDVNKGAQRMYDMMKKLENGGRV
jgi:hypothetical protein